MSCRKNGALGQERPRTQGKSHAEVSRHTLASSNSAFGEHLPHEPTLQQRILYRVIAFTSIGAAHWPLKPVDDSTTQTSNRPTVLLYFASPTLVDGY